VYGWLEGSELKLAMADGVPVVVEEDSSWGCGGCGWVSWGGRADR
jgi:hypothetical protein